MSESAVSEQKTFVTSLVGFFSGTLLSRVSGFVRDISMAFFFGADASIAAFLVALRWAILLRRIFGEGALLNGFVPHFEAQRRVHPAQAAKFFRDTFFSLSFILLVLLGSLEFLLYWIAPHSQVFYLTRVILPGVLFVCLFGICSGLLHCEKHFFTSSAAPIGYNLIWILAVFLLRNKPPEIAAVGLSIAISLAFFFQWGITLPKTLTFLCTHLSWRELFQFRLFAPETRKMLSSLSLGVIGVTATQINTAIDAVFSRVASLEGPAYLTYAIHLQQLPLALFGVGVASVLLPALSKTQLISERIKLVEFSLSKSLFLLIPCTAAIFVGGSVSVNLLFGRGHFDSEALLQTTQCLWGYGFGLVPMALVLLLSPIFYAQKDYKTPTFCSLTAILVNLGLNALLVLYFRMGPASLAYSTSVAACVNVYLLCRQLRKAGIGFSSDLNRFVLSTTLCALFAASLTGWICATFVHDPTVLIVQSLPVLWDQFMGDQLLQFGTFFLCFSTFFVFAAYFYKRLRGLL